MNFTMGIDTHGNGIQYQIENAGGEPITSGQLPKTRTGWLELLEVLHVHQVEASATAIFIEATGRHHLAWCDRLHEEDYAVYQLNPLLTKRLYSSANAIRDNKTDKIDAATLCEIGRLYRGKLERFRYEGKSQKLGLQALVSARQTLRNQCTNLLKAGGDLLDLVFPEGKQVGLRLTSRAVRGLLLKAPTPVRLSQLPLETLREAVGDKAQKLHEAACSSLTPEAMAQASSIALVQLLENIEKTCEGIANFDHEIKRAVLEYKDGAKMQRLIGSLPGFGKVTVPIIVAFLPDDFTKWVPKEKGRYKKKLVAKLQAHFGYDPRVRESGKYKGKVKLSKRGVEAARTALFQASVCSLLHDPQLRAYYDKKKAEGDHHTKAIVDVMRKNLRRLVAVLIQEKTFEFRAENA